ncbi:MAG: heavy metal translocating P-type ATPase metal-binding domain-containing protein [Flavobacteriales bacterium]|nr:heavy metal translocating P-type ATPase metal-binding domain-containing protein [Flavobacteriales bacterium]
MSLIKEKVECFHCSDECVTTIEYDDKMFCCQGCKGVYQLFSDNGMIDYYDLDEKAGIKPGENDLDAFFYLDQPEIKQDLLSFYDEASKYEKVNLHLPMIHCSACIWLLENLPKINSGVVNVRVNFAQRKADITYNKEKLSLRQLALFLKSIGYEPRIQLEALRSSNPKSQTDRNLLYKLGLAGFAFGNVMLLSFPSYFGDQSFQFSKYQSTFSFVSFLLSIPVILYSASDYIKAAYYAVKRKSLGIDIPITIGLFAIFFQSVWEITSHTGHGYFDSLTGLVFFLLIGKWFQGRVYKRLSFDNDYSSFFPAAVRYIVGDRVDSKKVDDLKTGDIIEVRSNEIIPVDCKLLSSTSQIDYSFVTGESEPTSKLKGNILFAGGRVIGKSVRLEVLKELKESQLLRLWKSDNHKKQEKPMIKLTQSIAKVFTITVLILAVSGFFFWLDQGLSKAIFVFSSVLIIACPCALALAAPFGLGNSLRLLAKRGFYLKDIATLERLTKIKHIVFDKTGTITSNKDFRVHYTGDSFSDSEWRIIKGTTRHSLHPLSIAITNSIDQPPLEIDNFQEIPGKGLKAEYSGKPVALGSEEFIRERSNKEYVLNGENHVMIALNEKIGAFTVRKSLRQNIKQSLGKLYEICEISLLSGDSDREEERMKDVFPDGVALNFDQSPEQKRDYIDKLQKHTPCMMIGDGLNDSGALQASYVGMAVSDDHQNFTPACDIITEGRVLNSIHILLKIAKNSMLAVRLSVVFSLLYNVIGLYFALSGNLAPIVAAILMPLSSISVVVFVFILTQMIHKRTKNSI